MPIHLTGGIHPDDGLIIPVHISTPEGTVSKEIRALVDTGASVTVICQSIIQEVSPKVFDFTFLSGVGTSNLVCYTHEVILDFKTGKHSSLVPCTVVAAELTGLKHRGGRRIGALIGRDLLRRCTLSYDGMANTYTLIMF